MQQYPRLFNLINLFLINILLSSCTESIIEPAERLFGSSYYPLEKGHFIEFSVEKITYKEFEPTDTSTYFLREEIGDTLTDLSGNIVQKILLYKTTDTLQNWALDSVWSVRYDFNRIIKSEHNTPFIKMVFPIESNLQWNGNALNTLDEQIYTVHNLKKSFKNFENTFKIISQNDSSLIDKNVKWEIYAEAVGMVESLQISLEYISDFSDPYYGTDSIQRGVYIHKQFMNSSK